MKLTLNKNEFVNTIVGPASKLADNLSLDFYSDSQETFVKTLVASSDNSLVFLGKALCKTKEPVRCVVPECKTFLRLFSGIEQEKIELEINSNSIQYKDKAFSFKYHLLDEGYLTEKKSLNEEKLNQIKFDLKFSTSKQKLSEIFKYNSIIPDAEKLYFFLEENKVFAKIGDDQKTNTNEIVTEISPSFEGDSLLEPLPINIQNILLMTFASDAIQIEINKTLKIVKFSASNVQYILSGLVK